MTKISSRRTVVLLFGIMIGLSSINHGVFEVIQGNKPITEFFISAIGPEQQMWEHGKEGAVTLWKTYQSSGIAAIFFGLSMLLWSIIGIHKRFGPWIFLTLAIGSLLSGGGVAQIVLFSVNFNLALRIHKTAGNMSKRLSENSRNLLAGLWLPSTIAAMVLGILAMFMGVTGWFPGVNQPNTALIITLVNVLSSMFLFCFAFICGKQRDLLNE